MRKQKPLTNFSGFTLVEIMIVVMIISMVASIALPNLRRVHEQAYFAKHKKQMLSMCHAVETYQANTGRWPGNITSLTSVAPPYIHSSIANRYCGQTIEGYTFTCQFNATYAFLFRADDLNTSATRYQCQRSATTGAYTVTDNPPL